MPTRVTFVNLYNLIIIVIRKFSSDSNISISIFTVTQMYRNFQINQKGVKSNTLHISVTLTHTRARPHTHTQRTNTVFFDSR